MEAQIIWYIPDRPEYARTKKERDHKTMYYTPRGQQRLFQRDEPEEVVDKDYRSQISPNVLIPKEGDTWMKRFTQD